MKFALFLERCDLVGALQALSFYVDEVSSRNEGACKVLYDLQDCLERYDIEHKGKKDSAKLGRIRSGGD